MKTHAPIIAALVLATACGPAVNGSYRGPPIVTLGGQLTLADGLSVGSSIRLAIAWYPNLSGDTPRAPRAIATEELSYTGSFPQNFTFPLYGPPAKAALEVVTHEDGGVGEAAVGQLLAYEDLDGDGQLTVDAAGHSTDRILGSTAGAGPFDFFSSEERSIVAWVKHADDLGLAAQGMKPGYNLLRATSPFVPPEVLPLDSPIKLRMTGEPRLALIVCPEAYAQPEPDQACGVTVWATPAVSGSITLQEDGALNAFVFVQANGQTTSRALVEINGTPLMADDSGLAFSFFEPAPSVLRVGRNLVRVEVTGYLPLELEAIVPERFELTTPLAGARVPQGSSLQVGWTAARGATQYSVSLFVDAPGSSGESVFTSDLSATIAVPNAAGPAQLTVSAFERLTFARSAVVGLSERVVSFDVVP